MGQHPIWTKYTLFSASFIVCAALAHTQSRRAVEHLDEAFVKETLSLSPSFATAQGLHEYNGVALDDKLDDFSAAGLERSRAVYRHFLDEVKKTASQQLSSEDRADLDLIRLACESQLFDLNQAQSARHNPTTYVEMIGNAIYTPLIQPYAPLERRLSQITARIEQIPTTVASAKANLRDSPAVWNQVAREENAGTIDLIDHEIRAKIPAALKSRYDKAATAAIASLHDLDAYLKDDLSKRTSDWRLGPKLYAEKFQFTLATGDTPARTLHDAEVKLENLRADMQKEATALFPKYFPGETVPSELNALVGRVLDKVARQHTTPARYFPDAKADLGEATAFVRAKNLLELPKTDNLQVIPTPEFMRGIFGVGGFSAAPALEPQLGAFYWITPFTPDMTPQRVESKLREYNRWGLKILTVHEAMPGHYVQFEYASQVKPKWRGILRELYSNGPYVEGWAVYATQLMIEQGWQDTPEMRLTFGKQMLRVVSNAILDIRLQGMGMTDQQAMDLMINQTFQEKEEATKKLQRAKLSSCQLPTYFVGWRGWDQIRTQYEQQRGAEFRLPEFHERALKEGGVPLPTLASLLAAP